MTEDEIEKERAKATAEVVIGTMYLKFIVKHNAKPQLIRVSTEIMSILVPYAEFRPVTYFEVPVILDDTLPTGGCICQWKN